MGGTEWHFIDLEASPNYTIPVGNHRLFSSGEWNGLPSGMANHPCVRVYILPPVFRADFDQDRIKSITTEDDIKAMVAAYKLEDQHMAQKNITRHNDIDSCPDPGCSVTRNSNPNGTETAPAQDAFSFVKVAMAQSLVDVSNVLASHPVSEVATVSSPQDPSKRPPILSKTGHDVLMSASEAKQFRPENLIVQIRAMGFSHPPKSSALPRYNFIEDLGGVLHLFPTEMLKAGKEIPFELNVTNPHVARTIFLHVDTLAPSGFEDVSIAIDISPTEFAPGETRVVRGIVIPRQANPQTAGAFKRWGLSLHAGVSIPHGNFGSFFSAGPNVGVDLEYRISSLFSLEGIYGFHHFLAQTFGAGRVGNLNVHQFWNRELLQVLCEISLRESHDTIIVRLGTPSCPGATNSGSHLAMPSRPAGCNHRTVRSVHPDKTAPGWWPLALGSRRILF